MKSSDFEFCIGEITITIIVDPSKYRFKKKSILKKITEKNNFFRSIQTKMKLYLKMQAH